MYSVRLAKKYCRYCSLCSLHLHSSVLRLCKLQSWLASTVRPTKNALPQTAWNVLQTLRLILWLRLCLKKKNTAIDCRRKCESQRRSQTVFCAYAETLQTTRCRPIAFGFPVYTASLSSRLCTK